MTCLAAQTRKPKRRPASPPDHGIHILENDPMPQDFKDMGMRAFHQLDRGAVVVFKDRVEFYRLPKETHLGKVGLTDGVRSVSLFEFKPLKVMRFATLFDVRSEGNTLICTHPTLPRTSTQGIADFCGIASPEGEVLFKFPYEQHMPYDMLEIIGISKDGRYAEVFVGRLLPDLNDRRVQIVQPREILAWRYPNSLDRFDGPWSNGEPREKQKAMDALLKGFPARAVQP